MSLSSMIASATTPLGSIGSLYKLPATVELNDFSTANGSYDIFGQAMVISDPGFDPSALTGSMTTAVSDISTQLTAKINEIPNQLAFVSSAAALQIRVTEIDAIVSGTGYPDIINKAFPSPGDCPTVSIKDSFKTITETGAMVAGKINAMGSSLDVSGALAPMITAIQTAGGPIIASGKELLAYVANAPAAVVTAIKNSITASPTMVASLKGSFASAQSDVGNLTTDFSAAVVTEANAVAAASNFVKGQDVVNLISSSNPCINNVMANSVNPAQVDVIAVEVSNMSLKKEIVLPGQPTIVAVAANAEVPVITPVQTAPAAQAIPVPPGAIVPYTYDEVSDLLFPPVKAQEKIVIKITNAVAEFRKTYVEDWINTNQYEGKKLAAGAGGANTEGTSTDPAKIAAWKDVYDARPGGDIAGPFGPENNYTLPTPTAPYGYVQIREYVNSTVVPVLRQALLLLSSMKFEKSARVLYGKYPYTYMISVGRDVLPIQQYTYLDSGK